MPIIRKQLKPSDVYPDDIRYDEDTDTVQRFINGDWVDSPESDPRTQTTLPPRLTADPACDAAESVKDAIKSQVDGVLEAIDNASTLFTIAGIILSIFTFGVYAIFVGLALSIGDSMVGYGSSAIEAALTESAYEIFRCILFCHMDTSGRLDEGSLPTVMADVTSQIGGIGAVILNSMLALAGEGGVNNLASIGTSTGDCSECGCLWCYTFDFTLSEQGWNVRNVAPYGDIGRYTAGVGFQQLSDYSTVDNLTFEIIPPAMGNLTEAHVTYDPSLSGANPHTVLYLNSYGTAFSTAGGGTQIDFTGFSEDFDFIAFDVDPNTGSIQQWTGALVTVTLRGNGDNPFGADNC